MSFLERDEEIHISCGRGMWNADFSVQFYEIGGYSSIRRDYAK